jgi:hypothetical protein
MSRARWQQIAPCWKIAVGELGNLLGKPVVLMLNLLDGL